MFVLYANERSSQKYLKIWQIQRDLNEKTNKLIGFVYDLFVEGMFLKVEIIICFQNKYSRYKNNCSIKKTIWYF